MRNRSAIGVSPSSSAGRPFRTCPSSSFSKSGAKNAAMMRAFDAGSPARTAASNSRSIDHQPVHAVWSALPRPGLEHELELGHEDREEAGAEEEPRGLAGAAEVHEPHELVEHARERGFPISSRQSMIAS